MFKKTLKQINKFEKKASLSTKGLKNNVKMMKKKIIF